MVWMATVQFLAWAVGSSLLHRLAQGSTQPPIQLVLWACPLRVKQPVHDAVHSPVSGARVKNG
jgi:hypothetical protein